MIRSFIPVFLFVSISLGILPNNVQAHPGDDKPTLLIGILAFEPLPIVKQKWQPIIDELNRRLNHVQVSVQPYNYHDLLDAVTRRELDFVLTNSAYYVELAHSQGLSSPLVSLMSLHENIPLRGFGGVIAVRTERTDILSLSDLKGRTIASPKKGSFGGYMMQAYELLQADVALHKYDILETEMPHDKSIFAVLNHQADAAFIRTGVLESMIARGLINPQDLRVLNNQSLPGFPFSLSTRLYPEWPLAAMAHVDMEHAGQVAGALLALPYNLPVLRDAQIYGFSIPTDYEPVRDLMRTLKIKPYHIETPVSWLDIWHSHRLELLLAGFAMLVILALSLMLLFYNRRLSHTLELVRHNEETLRISAVAFETQEAILITDANEQIIRVNNAFTQITGFELDDVVGKTPRILKSGAQDKEFYQKMWDDILTYGGWRGEIWNRRKNGEIYPEHQVITAIKNSAGDITHYLSTFSDITQRKMNEDRIHRLAFYDPLTGLANRRLLEDHIVQALSTSARNKSYCALFFIDLDHFKNLNDTLGHKLGDEVLKQVANRLKECVRDGDTVARPGGDEFIILLEDIGHTKIEAASNAQHIAEKILTRFNDPYELSESRYVITASIGINLFIDHFETSEELMKRSDLAMYQAKAEGRNTIRFFDPAMQEVAAKRSEIEADLRLAIERDEFLLYYQPKVTFSGELQGYEALIRWQHPTKGMISPAEFIPVAEETGLILPIGKWVIREACSTVKQWQDTPALKGLILAINISARQFRQKEFVTCFTDIIDEHDIPANQIEIELTESLLMDDMDDTVKKMEALNKIGVHFALDDFGTGYSSLSYLKNLPLGYLKIDQSFVRDMLLDLDDAAIVETIITLAKTLKLRVIAEGVEQAEQAEVLNRLGCDLLQGYFFGKPAPLFIENLEEKLQ